MPKKDTKPKKTNSEDKKSSVPPDAFDDPTGTKMLISEVKKDTLSKKAENEKKSDSSEKVSEDKAEIEEIVDDKSAEMNNDSEKAEEGEDQKEKDFVDDVEGSMDSEPEEEDAGEEAQEQNTEPASFYEKVLGEKPPEKKDAEDEGSVDEKEGTNRSLFFLGGVVFVLTILIASAIGLIFINSQNQQRVAREEKISPTPSEEPTPTPVGIDREDFTFEVLNGSGESGKAGRTGDAIEAIGYTVDSVGNADSSDYSGLKVGFSEEIEDEVKEIIIKDLSDEFLGAEEDETLEPDGTDVIVVIGS